MRGGQLRHRVTIQRPVRSTNDIGESTLSWLSVCEVAAFVKPTSAREQIRNSQADHTITHVVTLRYTPVLSADCRLVFNDRNLNISSVINVDERDFELQLLCNELN